MQDTPLTKKNAYKKSIKMTNSLTGGDLEHLGGETDRTSNTKLLVLSTVDQIVADYSTHTLAQ